VLAKIIDPYGREILLNYNNNGRLAFITTPDNKTIQYGYDDNDNLTSVTYPDDTPDDSQDNPKKEYHYEDSRFPYHLTGISNENGVRYATWVYDSSGRAILSEHANSAEKVELSFNPDGTTTVTDALGHIKNYTFETHLDTLKPSIIQHQYNDGEQMISKQKSFTYYPENGRLETITDYNGSVSTYEYNLRGLITKETQALGTADEYTISTTWHPDYHLPATRIYPDRVETYSYDSQGKLTNTLTSSIQ